MAGSVPMHNPVIVTDGGPWAEHDVACAVCSERKAIYDLHFGIFIPCDGCRSRGWALVCIRPKRARRIYARMFKGHPRGRWY